MRVGIQELSVKGEAIVSEGIYRIETKGQAGPGEVGCVVLKGGRIAGTDGKVDYVGTYVCAGLMGMVQANIRGTVHPGTTLVTGRPPPSRLRMISM
jgi:hypothetical protein